MKASGTGPPERVKQYGADKHRTWRNLHLATNEATNDIYAVELTTNAVSDGEMVKTLLATIEQPIGKLGGDGAYDQVKVYNELASRPFSP